MPVARLPGAMALRGAALAIVAAAAAWSAGCAPARQDSAPAPSAPLSPAAPAVPAPSLCAELPETIVPLTWLALPATDLRGRRPFRADAVFRRYLLDPQAPPPAAGETLTGETGEAQAWEARQAEPDGSVSGDFAWGYASVTSPASRVMLAELSGASTLFVNGDGSAGDPYRGGFGVAPVALRAGENRIYVGGVREGFRLVLRQPEHALLLELSDTTLPDLVAGPAAGVAGAAAAAGASVAAGAADQVAGELAVTVINASLRPVPQLALASGGVGSGAGVFADVAMRDEELPGLPPLGVVKVPVRFAFSRSALPAAPASCELAVRLGGHPDEPARSETLRLACKAGDAPRRVTRRSRIDDSVQEYAVREPAPAPAPAPDAPPQATPGVVLTLHGAGVDELAQASSYAPKAGWWIVAPSNRRPFGFDWQDWGRLDAYEALDEALGWTGADAGRVALTGHSMGGHGTWHLAVNDADRFIAVAPSAGWASFDSYAGRPAGALAALWHAADGAGETLDLLPNLVDTPVYVLHGGADDNVPVAEGQALFDALVEAVDAARARGLETVSPQIHIQEGAGHWWDGDASPGADCLDWPPIFALFDEAARSRSGAPGGDGDAGADAGAGLVPPARFEWICADPGVDSRQHWISVIRPLEYGQPVRISASWDAPSRRVELATQNAQLIVLHWPDGQPPETCSIDGQAVTCGIDPLTGASRAEREASDVIERTDAGWSVWSTDAMQAEAQGWDPAQKSAARSGPFKRAFDNRFVLVYGTAGESRESAELLARARFDSEVWRYRGNGRAEVWSDRQFLSPGNLPRMAGRNVILYGNRDSNLAFDALVPPGCPLAAARGRIALGDRAWEGDGLAALVVYPRVGEHRALLGFFADSGPAGSRLGYTLSPFVSGVGCPDYAIFDASVLVSADGGVAAAGWFGRDWLPP